VNRFINWCQEALTRARGRARARGAIGGQGPKRSEVSGQWSVLTLCVGSRVKTLTSYFSRMLKYYKSQRVLTRLVQILACLLLHLW
jgi:hypothetical protein